MQNKELFGPLPLRGGGGDEAGVFGRLGGGGVCLKQHERSEYLVSGDRGLYPLAEADVFPAEKLYQRAQEASGEGCGLGVF